MKAVILAAGIASRLRPLTDTTPKCLLKVGERCLLQRAFDALLQNGFREFVIVTGYRPVSYTHLIECLQIICCNTAVAVINGFSFGMGTQVGYL